MTAVLLVAERDEQGEINQSTMQSITAASRLSDAQVTVVIAGDAPASASSLPVDKIVTITSIDPADDGIYEQLTADLAALVSSSSPDVVILSRSDFGAVVGARLAFRIDAAFASDCIDFTNESGTTSVTRPVYGGSALAEFEIASTPAVLTLRPGAFEPSVATGTPVVEAFASESTVARPVTVLDVVAESREGIRLEDAKFVVSGGRGLGGPVPFSILSELPKRLAGPWVLRGLHAMRAGSIIRSRLGSPANRLVPICT